MTRISGVDCSCMDMEWYGVDKRGQIAVFCSAGVGNLAFFWRYGDGDQGWEPSWKTSGISGSKRADAKGGLCVLPVCERRVADEGGSDPVFGKSGTGGVKGV